MSDIRMPGRSGLAGAWALAPGGPGGEVPGDEAWQAIDGPLPVAAALAAHGQWRLDGRPIGTGSRIEWLPRPGRHVLERRDASASDRIEFEVRDAKTAEDLTRSILLQIILEEEAGGASMFTEDLLAKLLPNKEQPKQKWDLRNYGIGAQILLDLGVREMLLLSNSKRAVIGLEGYGLTITGYQGVN